MADGRLLATIGLVRQARPAGFCPACRVLLKALDAREALAQPGYGGRTGSGSGRRLLLQPDQTREPGSLPRAVCAAWATALQPDAERRGRRRALRPQLPWMQRGAHGGHGPPRDVQSVVGGNPEHRRPRLQVRASAAHAIRAGSFRRYGGSRRGLSHRGPRRGHHHPPPTATLRPRGPAGLADAQSVLLQSCHYDRASTVAEEKLFGSASGYPWRQTLRV